jgi:ribonuclease PH
MTIRLDKRANNEIRKISIETQIQEYAEGSCLISFGKTKVLCSASLEERQPGFLRDTHSGWITAEYSMLPRATLTRTQREIERGRPKGRTQEIQRLIGRSLRAAINLDLLGPRTVTIDCDVIQADGGTRTASITGGYVALRLALAKLIENKKIPSSALLEPVAAISAGIVDGVPILDLCYEEDSRAGVDLNVVMAGGSALVEIQGTAEGKPFSKEELDQMISLAEGGIQQLFVHQNQSI